MFVQTLHFVSILESRDQGGRCLLLHWSSSGGG